MSPVDTASVHVINIDIQDNHEEATIGAFLICELVSLVMLDVLLSCLQLVPLFGLFLTSVSYLQMADSEDLDNDIDELLHEFESKCQRPILHCVLFY